MDTEVQGGEVAPSYEEATTKLPDKSKHSTNTSNTGAHKTASENISNDPPNYNSTVLYQDKFCILYPDRIKLKLYYFPFGSKTIKYSTIKNCVKCDSSFGLLSGKTKNWGMALNDIWWACDMRFQGRVDHGIIIDIGSWPRKGFSAENRDKVFGLVWNGINGNVRRNSN